jgi:hypothetical protein
VTSTDPEPSIVTPRPRWERLDTIGAGLFLALAAWIVLVGQFVGGDPWPSAVLVLLTGGTLFAAREFTRWYGVFVPGTLVTVLVLLVVFAWPEATHRTFGLLGYANANGALYAIGVGAAGLVVLRASLRGSAIAAAIAAVGLALLPWLIQSKAAAGSAAVVLGVTFLLLHRRGRSMAWLRPAVVVAATIALVGTVTAGLLYTGDGEGDGGGSLTERRLVLWRDATEMALASPLVGQGPGRFGELSPTAQRDRDARWAHHEPLTLAAERGCPGCSCSSGSSPGRSCGLAAAPDGAGRCWPRSCWPSRSPTPPSTSSGTTRRCRWRWRSWSGPVRPRATPSTIWGGRTFGESAGPPAVPTRSHTAAPRNPPQSRGSAARRVRARSVRAPEVPVLPASRCVAPMSASAQCGHWG